jgi:hypothetical protein
MMFFEEIISRGQIFFWTIVNGLKPMSDTHTQAQKKLKPSLNPLEAKLKKNEIDSESACSEDSASLYKIKIGHLQAKL